MRMMKNFIDFPIIYYCLIFGLGWGVFLFAVDHLKNAPTSTTEYGKIIPLITADSNKTTIYDDSPRKIVELGASGCIRGPFKVYLADGSVTFELAAGVDYPTGCYK